MPRRMLGCLGAVSAMLFLSGSIGIGAVTLGELQIGGVKLPGRWKVSAPTVQSYSGEYLAYDLTGQSARVSFTKDRGPHATWEFFDMGKFIDPKGLTQRPGRAGLVALEETGLTFRLRPADGPFRGWYLSRTGEGDLTLVMDRKRAALVRFGQRRREVISL